MNPRAFLELARHLLDENTPAKCRTAVSRAYYAVYNFSVETLKDLGIQVAQGPGGHGQVVNYFSNAGDRGLSEVGAQMGTLHAKRINADYRLANAGWESHSYAEIAVRQASVMLETVGRSLSGPRRDAIIQGIKEYRLKTNQ